MEENAALVGIVVVSHSAKVAEGTVDIAREMAGEDVRIVPAGGVADGALGTDASLVAEAIAAADGGAGVVVIGDLGSAILSAKTALELIDPGLASRVRLSDGPLVEGATVAAVQASIGDDLEAVLQAARDAAHLPKEVS